MIKEAIVKIVSKEDLTYDEAYTVMNEIMSGQTTPTQNAAFLAALSTKSARAETTDEIAGCAAAMRAHAVQVDTGMEVFEIVGTGGDNAHSFNISTTSGLVAAAGGVKVASTAPRRRGRGLHSRPAGGGPGKGDLEGLSGPRTRRSGAGHRLPGGPDFIGQRPGHREDLRLVPAETLSTALPAGGRAGPGEFTHGHPHPAPLWGGPVQRGGDGRLEGFYQNTGGGGRRKRGMSTCPRDDLASTAVSTSQRP